MSSVYMQNGWVPPKTNQRPQDEPPANRVTQFYRPDSLFGNWYEERADIRRLGQRKPMPAAMEHNYGTTYAAAYLKGSGCDGVPPVLKKLEHRDTFCYPGHQPELDPNRQYLHMVTEHQSAFVNHSKSSVKQ